MALNIPFTQIVRLIVLVSFCNICTLSPVALNIPFTQIVGLMVLVSFHKHMHRGVVLMVLVSFHKEMHTQPCGTELSYLSEGGAF